MAHLPEAILGLGKVVGDGCEITFATREGLEVPAHTHATTNYGVVTEGVLYLTLDDEERAYRRGDWFKVPAGAVHAERFEEKTSLVVCWLKGADD